MPNKTQKNFTEVLNIAVCGQQAFYKGQNITVFMNNNELRKYKTRQGKHLRASLTCGGSPRKEIRNKNTKYILSTKQNTKFFYDNITEYCVILYP
jgi:predicted transposase YbfD/YdcC